MDPLRPFSDLIRALWKSSAARVERTQGGAETRQATPERTDAGSQASDSAYLSLASQVRARIRQIGVRDPRRVREVFVETVIARELGLGASHAADVAELAQRVAAEIGANPSVSDRLHALLTALAEDPAAG